MTSSASLSLLLLLLLLNLGHLLYLRSLELSWAWVHFTVPLFCHCIVSFSCLCHVLFLSHQLHTFMNYKDDDDDNDDDDESDYTPSAAWVTLW